MDGDKLKIGDVIVISKFHWNDHVGIKNGRWAVMIEDGGGTTAYPDGLVYTRGHDGKWHTQVMPVGGDDEFELAGEDDVPADIPDDFWVAAARYKMLGEAA